MDKDPSMEDILASIRRIITEDPPRPGARPEAPAPAAADGDEVLDLVEPAGPPPAPPPGLGSVAVSGYAGAENTLETLVRSMLTPMLREWLDANLPAIVEQAVRSEVTRITRKD